jgi:hypothetical protein
MLLGKNMLYMEYGERQIRLRQMTILTSPPSTSPDLRSGGTVHSPPAHASAWFFKYRRAFACKMPMTSMACT